MRYIMKVQMKIPIKISGSPIIEAIAEVQFDNELPSVVLYGKMYAALAAEFGQTETMPILEMPNEFVNQQPELRYAVHYRLKNKDFAIGIGQRIISINRICTDTEYDGWDKYALVIQKVLTELEKTEFVTNVSRVSVKYVNLFTDSKKSLSDIFNVSVNFIGEDTRSHNELILSFYKDIEEGTKLGVGLSAKATVNADNYLKNGILLNLDAFKDTETSLSEAYAVMGNLHKIAEEGFFSAISQDQLESMEPVYE